MSDLALSPAPTDDPLERVRRHVEAELFEPLTLTQLANVAGLSAYHISRASSARGSGVSPMAYARAWPPPPTGFARRRRLPWVTELERSRLL
jgi:AraC-like DNA-binding protein